jgi:hypothetical protein
MTVAQGDSTIDAAIVHRAPAPADGSKPVITIVQPKICKR